MIQSSSLIFFIFISLSFCRIRFFLKNNNVNGYNDLIGNPDFEGIKVVYTWKDLEPSEGVYDFSKIESDLTYCNTNGITLWIQIQTTEFCSPEDCASTNDPLTPEYMWNQSKFGCEPGKYGNYERRANNAGGWYPCHSNPFLAENYHKLFEALGEQFNDRDGILGLTLGETAAKMNETYNITKENYEVAIKDNILALKKAFPNKIVHQNVNYCKWDIPPFIEWLLKHKISFGGPDILYDSTTLNDIVYPLHLKYHNVTQHGHDIQWSNYEQDNSTGGYYTSKQLLQKTITDLNPRYLWWAKRQPYFDDDVVSAVRDYVSNTPSTEDDPIFNYCDFFSFRCFNGECDYDKNECVCEKGFSGKYCDVIETDNGTKKNSNVFLFFSVLFFFVHFSLL